MTGDLPSDVRIPDVVGEVSGWRAWRLVGTSKTPRLMSVTATDFRVDHVDAIWPTNRWYTAACPHGHVAGQIPVESCKCGIYAARDRDQLIKLGYGVYTHEDNRVIGEVAFAGKVIPGTQGFRAEKARVIRLFVPYENWRMAEALGAAYRVPVEVGFLFSPTYRNREGR
jgi:hypothetical protein